MDSVTLTKEQMLNYWDAQAAIIQNVANMSNPARSNELKKAVDVNKKTRAVFEKANDEEVFFIPGLTMADVKNTISTAKNFNNQYK